MEAGGRRYLPCHQAQGFVFDDAGDSRHLIQILGVNWVETPVENGTGFQFTAQYACPPEAGIPTRPMWHISKYLPESLQRHIQVDIAFDRQSRASSGDAPFASLVIFAAGKFFLHRHDHSL